VSAEEVASFESAEHDAISPRETRVVATARLRM
jgi:hypothetical protein